MNKIYFVVFMAMTGSLFSMEEKDEFGTSIVQIIDEKKDIKLLEQEVSNLHQQVNELQSMVTDVILIQLAGLPACHAKINKKKKLPMVTSKSSSINNENHGDESDYVFEEKKEQDEKTIDYIENEIENIRVDSILKQLNLLSHYNESFAARQHLPLDFNKNDVSKSDDERWERFKALQSYIIDCVESKEYSDIVKNEKSKISSLVYQHQSTESQDQVSNRVNIGSTSSSSPVKITQNIYVNNPEKIVGCIMQ